MLASRLQVLRIVFLVCGSVLAACSTTTEVNVDDLPDGEAGATATGGTSGMGGASGASGGAAAGGEPGHGGHGASAGQGGEPGNDPLDCGRYCDTIGRNCSSVPQYPSRDSCLAACATWPVGTLDDRSGHSLGCRLYHSNAAEADATTHCPHAGPAGVGTCGDNCEGYCSLMLELCPGQYESLLACTTTCAAMAGVDATEYQADASGDNLQCRIYHATFAAESSGALREVHCQHASSVPTAPCAGP